MGKKLELFFLVRFRFTICRSRKIRGTNRVVIRVRINVSVMLD